METVQILTSTGDEFSVSVESSCTVEGLKEAIDDEIGVGPSKQQLFFLGYPLTETDHQIQGLLQMSRTFNLVISAEGASKGFGMSSKPKPRGFFCDKEMFLITGKEFSFKAIQLKPNQEEQIRLKSNRFGVVQQIEGSELGKRIFHLRLYEVEREGRIERWTENGEDKVFLVIDGGIKIALKPLEKTTYDESKKVTPIEFATAVAPYITAAASFFSGAASFAGGS